MQVPIIRPYIGVEEIEAVREVLESGWLIQGKKVEEFEEKVRDVTGTQYAKACSSCTTALHMSLLALGIGAGDRVMVPAYTFVASANAIEYCGAIPTFVDIELDTFNISMRTVEEAWAKHFYSWYTARAIMPVHLFGLCAEMPKIMEFAKEKGLPVVEDAACALGSTSPAGKSGAMADIGCFSFHPRKPIATGEGGMMTMNNSEIADKVHALRDFGFTVTNLERHQKGATIMPSVDVLGYNYRMTDIQAAIGVEQMKKFPWILKEKQRRAAIYDRELANVGWLITPQIPDGYNHTYQSYACLVAPKVDRDKVMGKLKDDGIATRQGTHAVPLLGYYAKKYTLSPADFPNTLEADRRCLTIPLFPHMTDEEQEYVISCIRKVRT